MARVEKALVEGDYDHNDYRLDYTNDEEYRPNSGHIRSVEPGATLE